MSKRVNTSGPEVTRQQLHQNWMLTNSEFTSGIAISIGKMMMNYDIHWYTYIVHQKTCFFGGVLTMCLEVLTVKRIVWNQWPLFSHCICLAVTSKKQQQWPVMNLSMDWLENLNGKPWFLPSNMSFPANYPFIQFWKYHDLSISITWACREWQWSSQGSKM